MQSVLELLCTYEKEQSIGNSLNTQVSTTLSKKNNTIMSTTEESL